MSNEQTFTCLGLGGGRKKGKTYRRSLVPKNSNVSLDSDVGRMVCVLSSCPIREDNLYNDVA